MMNDRAGLAVAAPLHILYMYGTQQAPHGRFELSSKGTGHAVIEIERNMTPTRPTSTVATSQGIVGIDYVVAPLS
jgi:hypothetical protein